MGSVGSKRVLRDPKTYGAVFLIYTVLARWFRNRARNAKRMDRVDSFEVLSNTQKTSKKRVGVDRVFLDRLRMILKIVLPWGSKEMGILSLHTGFLVARTFASIYVAKLDGAIVKTIVDQDSKAFISKLIKWLLFAIPATYINSMIRFLESKLSIAFRSRLVNKLYDDYMRNETYYRVSNIDSRMANPDQGLTADVATFSSELAHIYSQLSKPLLDIFLMSLQLMLLAKKRSGQLHLLPGAIVIGVVVSTGFILRYFTPPFGLMVAEEARRYGALRAIHSRLITHSEEIAFYGGHVIEKSNIKKAYKSLVTHMDRIFRHRVPFTMLEQFLMKYVWGGAGLVLIAIPTLQMEKKSVGTSDAQFASQKTQDFITSRGLLVSAADAMERIMSSWKEIAQLAGYTSRITEMIHVFEDVGNGIYEKGAVNVNARRVLEGRGQVVDGQDCVSLENVPIVTPNGDILVPEVNIRVDPGQHLLITGPNGCGKSSLFRMIGGLWPVYGGTLYKPKKADMFYIPQRPYLSAGCLREQFIYPDTTEDMRARGLEDTALLKILQVVDLLDIVQREKDGWDAHKDWREVLSGGEKQRVAMARLFYHKPAFAILDECTSGECFTSSNDF